MYSATDVLEGVPEYARTRIHFDETELLQEARVFTVPSICSCSRAVQMDEQHSDHVSCLVWILMRQLNIHRVRFWAERRIEVRPGHIDE